MEQYHIFVPSEREMKFSYPELGRSIAFSDLSDKEVRFCWYYGCASSYIISLPEKQRAKEAVKIIFGKEKSLVTRALEAMEFDDRVSAGINKMASFSIVIRNKAYEIINNTFNNINWATDVIEEDSITSMLADFDIELSDNVDTDSIENDDDIGDKALYSDMSATANTIMPDMVRLLEEGFGLSRGFPIKEELLSDHDTGDGYRAVASRIAYRTFNKLMSMTNIDDSTKQMSQMKHRKKVVNFSKIIVNSISSSVASIERNFEKEVVKKSKVLDKGKLIDRILGDASKYFIEE